MNNNMNGKHETSSWSRPTMAEFRGSSPARPWVLDATGALVLQSNKPLKNLSISPRQSALTLGSSPCLSLFEPSILTLAEGARTRHPPSVSPARKSPGHPTAPLAPEAQRASHYPLPAITPPLERRVDFSAAPFPFVSPAITPPLERWVNFLCGSLPICQPRHHSALGAAGQLLRSAPPFPFEFSLHGAIILDNFDVFDHVQTARVCNDNIIENALDDHPITVPSGRSRSLSPRRATSGSLRTRSQSAPLILLGLWTSRLTAAAAPAQHTVPIDKNFSALPIHINTSPRDYTVTSTIVQWDGRSSRPLVDRKGRVIAVLGGRPNDPEYLRLTEEAANHLESTCGNPALHLDRHIGCRGTFPRVSAGGFIWRWTTGNLTLTAVLQESCASYLCCSVSCVSLGFANGLFRTWNSVVHALYTETLDALVARNSGLICNFPREVSAFAAVTFNFGPATITFPHTDALNLTWGWCAITALGAFDPRRGGHLVLWDLCLVIHSSWLNNSHSICHPTALQCWYSFGGTPLLVYTILRRRPFPLGSQQASERRLSCEHHTAMMLRLKPVVSKSVEHCDQDRGVGIERYVIRIRLRSSSRGEGTV
ncbi:hypothetical protein B0H14DRAFT_3516363 [Mycena olivaceomarginata]|nr:hypothetical protein B0H14DRAFT_3516363 [Mycena olivaceomarginata]